MTAKHTPGPWVVRTIDQSLATVETQDGEYIICTAAQLRWDDWKTEHAERKANARLIAAAPELLEAAKLVLEWYEAEDNHSGTDFYQRMQMCRDSEDAIRAAIAKATGEQT